MIFWCLWEPTVWWFTMNITPWACSSSSYRWYLWWYCWYWSILSDWYSSVEICNWNRKCLFWLSSSKTTEYNHRLQFFPAGHNIVGKVLSSRGDNLHVSHFLKSIIDAWIFVRDLAVSGVHPHCSRVNSDEAEACCNLGVRHRVRHQETQQQHRT